MHPAVADIELDTDPDVRVILHPRSTVTYPEIEKINSLPARDGSVRVVGK